MYNNNESKNKSQGMCGHHGQHGKTMMDNQEAKKMVDEKHPQNDVQVEKNEHRQQSGGCGCG